MQTDRQFQIIYTLLRKTSVSAGELAEQLGVSKRTIFRDIDTLSLAGIPIYAERGKGGGIRLLPDFVLDKTVLSEQEQSEILSALQGLTNIKTGDTDQTLQKLSAIFNKPEANWLEVDFSAWHNENDFFNDLKVAILERRVVAFDYYNTYGSKTFRRIEPTQLWFKSKAWYLKGYCLTKQGMRLYKLSRIKNLTVTDERYTLRNLPAETEKSAQENHAQFQWVTLKLHIAQEMAYQVYDDFIESEIEQQPDGSYIITTTTPETSGLYNFLLSYRKYLEVLEPEHIRIVIKNEAEEILKKY